MNANSNDVLISGHKFGLSYVGVGWVVWRDKAHLPKDLIFELHYLGRLLILFVGRCGRVLMFMLFFSVEYSFSLNFSRPAHPIIAQYFNFIHLGFQGYRSVAIDDLKNARLLARALEKSGYYYVLSDVHRMVGQQGLLEKAVGVDEQNVEVSISLCQIIFIGWV